MLAGWGTGRLWYIEGLDVIVCAYALEPVLDGSDREAV
jgi:hypothetical protein